ncbi:unnamed protein product [Owenia fusiformis]|uniref:Uncharacterized protein n=1 Tax=Owenia fusiformis TaxID=6347 RepID=A0A8J1Y5V2_OWEFU|nr:unnamed protein product [Owenia fusiformis]
MSDRESLNPRDTKQHEKNYTQLLEGQDGKGEAPKISGKAWGRVAKIFRNRSDYPTCVFLILGNEFCERFSYYGIRTILVIYLSQWLKFSEDTSTAIYHMFVMLCYFSPLFGAMLADGFIGKYKTILYLSILYAIGNAIVSFTAFPPPESAGPIIGLIVIGIGTGGIKPCVSSLGGDQFAENQVKQRATFFSIFYFAINAGSVLSTFITPILRADVQCFGGDCYPLAFGVPTLLMIVALLLFVAGTNLYKRNPPSGNVIGNFFCSIGRAIKNKCGIRGKLQKEHWLDYADDRYDAQFLSDVKDVLRVLLLFIPLPVFWALFDQMGSRWTLQAQKMNGKVWGDWHVKPDQISVLNPVMILLFIPLFESAIYPLLDKCKIPNRPLQRMVVGMLFASASFYLAGFLQITIDEAIAAPLDVNQADVRFLNAAECPLNVHTYNLNIDSLERIEKRLNIGEMQPLEVSYNLTCKSSESSIKVPIEERRAYTVLFYADGAKYYKSSSTKPRKNKCSFSLINVLDSDAYSLVLQEKNGETQYSVGDLEHLHASKYSTVLPYSYQLYGKLGDNSSDSLPLGDIIPCSEGGAYTILLIRGDANATSGVDSHIYVDVASNKVSMFWQIPQYVMITAGEILFSVTGLSFAYSQAPASMKSVLMSNWLLTTAFGNLIVLVIAEAQFFESQTAEFFMFATLMLVVTVIFAVMTCFYTYVTPPVTEVQQLDDLSSPDKSDTSDKEGESLTSNFDAQKRNIPKYTDESPQ